MSAIRKTENVVVGTGLICDIPEYWVSIVDKELCGYNEIIAHFIFLGSQK